MTLDKFQIFDSISTGIFIINSDYKVVFWNNYIEEWTTINAEDIVGKTLTDYFPLFNNDIMKFRLHEVFENGSPVILSSNLNKDLLTHSTLATSNKQIFEITVTGLPEEDNFLALFTVNNVSDLKQKVDSLSESNHIARKEIEQRKKAEKELQEGKLELQLTNRELNLIFENTPFTHFLLDENRKVLKVNNDNLKPTFINGELANYPGNLMHCIHLAGGGHLCGDTNACTDCFTKRVFDKTILTKENQNKEGKIDLVINNEKIERHVNMSTSLFYTNKNELRVLVSILDITKRKEQEEKIKLSEQRLASAIEGDNLGMFEVDIETMNVNVSDLYFEITDIPAVTESDKIANLWFSKIYPDDLEKVQLQFKKAIEVLGDKLSTVDFRYVHSKKGLIWLKISGRISDRNADGSGGRQIGFIQDITEAKKQEKELKASRQHFKDFSNITLEGLVIHKDGKFLEVNETFCKMFGYEHDELIGQNIIQFMIPPEFHQTLLENFKKEDSGDYEFQAQRKDGKRIPVEVASQFIEWKGEKVRVASVRNLTERKKQEILLKQSEEKYRLIADNISDIVWKSDLNLNFNYISPSVYKMRGFTVEEALASGPLESYPYESLISAQKVIKEKLEQIQAGDSKGWNPAILDFQMYRKDKTLFWVQVAAQIIGKDGVPSEIIGITRDISKQKEAEMALFNTNKLLKKKDIEKDKFISILGHDLINLIGGSLPLVELIELKGENWKDRNLVIEQIANNNKAAYQLLKNIVEWGRSTLGKQKFQPRSQSVLELFEKAQGLYQTQLDHKGINLNINCERNSRVMADPNMLDAILRNLVKNAIKYTEQEGTINLDVKLDDSIMEFCISDTGVGMTKEKADNLFSLDKVQSMPGTDGEKGTGLGLQLVKEYIEIHKGEIWVESELGKGTKVFFTIPAKEIKE